MYRSVVASVNVLLICTAELHACVPVNVPLIWICTTELHVCVPVTKCTADAYLHVLLNWHVCTGCPPVAPCPPALLPPCPSAPLPP